MEAGCGYGMWAATYAGGSLGYGRLSSSQTSPDDPAVSISDKDSGFAAGAFVGRNWQCDRYVFGIEADISYANMETNGSQTANYGAGAQTLTLGSNLSWFGTIRGRLGVSHDDFLFYATGGLAFAAVEHDFTYALGCCVAEAQDRDMRLGWTVGAGVERMWDRYTFRVEGLYVDLRDEERTYELTAYCGTCRGRVDYEDDFFIIRAALGIKFGRHEEPSYK